jgi:hypothetical protein
MLKANKPKIKDFGMPKVALEIFSEFAGNKQLTNSNAELEANKSIEKSLLAYGKNIFAIRVEMPSGDIIWQNGMYNVLGREDIKQYDEFQACFHPKYLGSYNFWSNCLFEAIAVNNFDFTGLVFHIRIPLKNEENGLFYWYNQHSIALISDTMGSVLSFLSVYTYDSEYSERNPVVMLPSISYENKVSPLDKVLKKIGASKILQQEFTEMERNILSCYADGIQPIARFQTMKPNTVYDYNKKILEKARNVFQYNFSNAENVAKFMKENSLLENDFN